MMVDRTNTTLVLFANVFPYGKSAEAYLETEIKYYDQFDKVYIISLAIKRGDEKTQRQVGDNVTVIPIRKASAMTYILGAFPALTDKNIYKEMRRLRKSGRLSIANIIQLFIYFSRSGHDGRIVANELKDKITNDTVFYSYRFDFQPYTAIIVSKLLKKDIKIVSRAHGYDLYENRKPHGYIPMREELLKKLNAVYPCSEHGTKYLQDLFPRDSKKIATRFLGTTDYGIKEYESDKCYEIVSCSLVTPIKRLHILIDALAMISDYPISWTHYGDGVLMDEIKDLAKEKLKIPYNFTGNVDNNVIIRDYTEKNYYLFVNVSSSEGLPVSIMEAISFGIPCIATDVGGTGEIITDGCNGSLVSQNITPLQLSEEIKKYITMSKDEYLHYRRKARSVWENKFNADKNYHSFVNELMNNQDEITGR